MAAGEKRLHSRPWGSFRGLGRCPGGDTLAFRAVRRVRKAPWSRGVVGGYTEQEGPAADLRPRAIRGAPLTEVDESDAGSSRVSLCRLRVFPGGAGFNSSIFF